MREEIWKPIIGFEGLYEVSNMGRIKCMKKSIFIGPCKSTKKVLPEKVMSPSMSNAGYLVIGLCKFRRYYKRTVHSLVWDAFGSTLVPKGFQIDHIDGCKTNNLIDNLQILSRRDNTSKSVKIDGKLTGAFKNGNKWIARMSVNNRLISLGSYSTQEEAHMAYITHKTKLEQNG